MLLLLWKPLEAHKGLALHNFCLKYKLHNTFCSCCKTIKRRREDNLVMKLHIILWVATIAIGLVLPVIKNSIITQTTKWRM